MKNGKAVAVRTMLALAVLALPIGLQAQKPDSASGGAEDPRLASGRNMIRNMATPPGPELDRMIASASVHPLGSSDNPVRAELPTGQRAYLDRLRCSDGAAPTYERTGNVGPGVFRNIVDLYAVRCADGVHDVYMDMYHLDYVETGAVPGFTIVDP